MPDHHALVPVRSSITRRDRALARELDRVGAATAIQVAETRAVEAIEITKAQALGSIAQAGLAEAAHLSAAELALAEQHPYAFGRLRHIGDAAALAIAERVRRASQRLG